MQRCVCAMVFGALVGVAASLVAQTPGDFYLHAGDRVLFYGDSITDQKMYTTLTELYVATRYPSLEVSFVNSGWGGDSVKGGGGGDIDTRLKRDVLPYKPTVVTVMLGMNDGGYKAPTVASDEAFFHGMEHIIQTIEAQDAGVRLTLIEPSPYDNVTRPPAMPVMDGTLYNQVLLGYSHWIANYGSAHHLLVVDANTPLVHLLERADGLNPTVAKEILPDHIHPAFGGHMVLSEALLKGWNARPTVAAVTLDAAGGQPQVRSAEHAVVKELEGKDGLRWTETDDALPLPFAQWQAMWGGGPTIALAIQASDLGTALNSEPLTVTGLARGVYALRIDGAEIGTYTNEQLANGVNLALLKTPMSDQAMEVYQLVTQHVDLHWDRWRHVQVALEKDGITDTEPAMTAMDHLEAEVVAKERQAAKPRPHTFALVAVH